MRSSHELAELLRERGLRLTPQRQAVFSVLDGNGSHPTADAVHAAVTATLPNVSLRTVYSVLRDLADLGEITQLDLGTGAYRFDPNTSAHDHFVCDRCGAVHDVESSDPSNRPTVVGDHRFRITAAHVVFRGICDDCHETGSSDGCGSASADEPATGAPILTGSTIAHPNPTRKVRTR